jgi:hypothetical protein
VVVVLTYHGDWCGVDIWVGDEMERIFEKHKSGLCGRRSREPSHGNWEARGLDGAWRLYKKVYFLHQTWSGHVLCVLSHLISRIEPGIEELSWTSRIPRLARSLHREESILAVFQPFFWIFQVAFVRAPFLPTMAANKQGKMVSLSSCLCAIPRLWGGQWLSLTSVL